MIRFLGRRVVYMAATMVVASLVLFLLFELDPESVVVQVLGPYSNADQRQLWLQKNGYFEPAYARYLNWLVHFAAGDWGRSRIFNMPAVSIVWTRLSNTAILGFWFFAFLIPLSLAAGVLAGMREGSRLDRTISALCVASASLPPFASTVLVSVLFVFTLGWLPGTSSMIDGFAYRELVLPVLVLVVYDFGYVARITRASMADVMTTPYIRTAMLKGLPYARVIVRHALRNALIAPFTVIMLHVNWLIAGVIVVEFFFAYKGFGSLILDASLGRDLQLLEACTMVTVMIAVGTQTIADIAYMYLNPRIRFK
ncbi:MAG: ABC transporter permease [Proteobacteria bacterium]|nr:ABC transporter permease [Pseudomonadota bacterium]